jgi:glycosyltransferase 2 family protein
VFRRLRVVIGLAISLLFIALLLWRADPRKIADALLGANYVWLIPAVLIFFVELWVRAVRYQHIVKTLRPATVSGLFPILVIGNMANNLLPLRIGELVRAYMIGERYQLSKMASFGTGVVERLFDGLTLLALLAGTVVILGASGAIHDITLTAVAVFALALAVFIGCLASPDGSEQVVAKLARPLPVRFRHRVVGFAVSFIEGLRSLRHPDAIAWVVSTSFVCWLLETLVFTCVGQAFGLDVGWGYYIMAVSAANLALTAPSSPGGTGLFEFVVMQVMRLAGVEDGTAAAYALAAHFTVLLPATLLGLYCLWSMHLSLGKLSHTAEVALEPVIAEADHLTGD